MNEAQRFLRYVTPGLVFGTELGILLWVLDPAWTSKQLSFLTTTSGVAAVFAAFLASGGFGFLFSAAHHSWQWRKGGTFMDHSKALEDLIQKDALSVHGIEKGTKIPREQAWVMMTVLWHERLDAKEEEDEKTDDKNKEYEKKRKLNRIGLAGVELRLRRHMDLIHSLGASRMASLAAAIAGIMVLLNSDLKVSGVISFLVAASVAVASFWMLQSGYVHTALLGQAIIDQALTDALIAQKEMGLVTTTWPVFPKALGQLTPTQQLRQVWRATEKWFEA